MKRHSQKGIALVVTLIMLSLVTFLAVAFLGVSQRERTSNALTSGQTESVMAAEAGFARGQAEFLFGMMRNSNRFNYGLLVSTNYINPAGFAPQGATTTPNPLNVNYDFYAGTFQRITTPADRIQNLANLLYDPRPPVYVNVTGALDFRFYVDINRNGTNERTGMLPEIDAQGRFFPAGYVTNNTLPLIAGSGPLGVPSGVLSNFMSGDPEWIGILEHPDRPHGPGNRFVARYAYLVLPAGLSLDLNFIHNQAKRPTGSGNTNIDGFLRNQGYGSWELNLAGFLADLNPSTWYFSTPQYNYHVDKTPSVGFAFEHAKDLLRHRYLGDFTRLASFNNLYGSTGNVTLANQQIDAYSDGNANSGDLYLPATQVDFATNLWNRGAGSEFNNRNLEWSGAPNLYSYFDIQELFATNGRPKFQSFRTHADALASQNTDFTGRLKNTVTNNTPSTQDRYTFHRLLAQLGVDSAPPNPHRKINLNFNDIPPNTPTDFIPWTAQTFFTNAINRIIPFYLNTNGYLITNGSTVTTMSLTNIPIYPQSYYSAELHRLLQVTANIYDAMSQHQTNGVDASGNPVMLATPPSVFRPVFYKQITAAGPLLSIVDYVQVTNVPLGATAAANSFFLTNLWATPEEVATNTLIPAGRLDYVQVNGTVSGVNYGGYYDVSLKGIPLVVGAKKGLPSFNEFGMQTTVLASRRLELVKLNATNKVINATNQMLTFVVTNAYGLEIFNPYATAYPRTLEMRAQIDSTMVITNYQGTNGPINPVPMFITNTSVSLGAVLAPNYFNTKGRFSVFITNKVLLPGSILYTNPVGNPNLAFAQLTNTSANSAFQNSGPGLPVPSIGISISNNVRYILVDRDLGKVIDVVNFTNLTGGMDVLQAMRPTTSGAIKVNSSTLDFRDMWDPTPTANGGNRGVTNQIFVGITDYSPGSPTPPPANLVSLWTGWNDPSSKPSEITGFKIFMGATNTTNTVGNKNPAQTPYNPSIKLVQNLSWEANDPFVHYMAADLLDPTFNANLTNAVAKRPKDPVPLSDRPLSLGATNWHYSPWGGGKGNVTSYGTNDFNIALKDPGVRGADDWDFYTDNFFPTNRIANIGWLGRVHRGSPWQTIYMKSPVASLMNWYNYSGSYATHPTNDWRLFDMFTVAVNDNAARGTLSVNQTNLAAWSAVLSGVAVVTNNNPSPGPFSKPTAFANLIIEPNSPQLRAIVEGINRTRGTFLGGVFTNMGLVLATPELSTNSPYLNKGGYQISAAMNDMAEEKIPQQIMSLLTLEEHPRVVIYAFGQALKPAQGRPFVLTPGPFFMMCTNYQITGETITRTLLHVENMPSMVEGQTNATPRVVVESFNLVPGYEY